MKLFSTRRILESLPVQRLRERIPLDQILPDREEMVLKFSTNRPFLQALLGSIKVAFKVVSLPVIRDVHPWVSDKHTHGVTLPINQDFMFDLVFTFAPLNLFFQNFSGTLDSNGQAEATFDYPGYPGSAGLVFYFAWMCYAPFDYVSNTVPVAVTTYDP